MSYLDLLAKYAPDVMTGKRLLALRYGDVAGTPCGTRRPDLDPGDAEDRLVRVRREEFCGQRNPYDPETAIDRDIYDAIVNGRLDRIQTFLRDGGDPNRPLRVTDGGWHPLKAAIYADDRRLRSLCSTGANFELSGRNSGPWWNGMDRVWIPVDARSEPPAKSGARARRSL
jgi:hypothetical protein